PAAASAAGIMLSICQKNRTSHLRRANSKARSRRSSVLVCSKSVTFSPMFGRYPHLSRSLSGELRYSADEFIHFLCEARKAPTRGRAERGRVVRGLSHG